MRGRRCGVLLLAALSSASDLTLLPEHVRMGPFGEVVPADRISGVAPAGSLKLDAVRGGYISCRLVISAPQSGAYELSISSTLEAELFREWFHFLPASKLYYPDALVPAALPYRAQIPDADNRIAGQKSQSFWLDLWVPADARPGPYAVKVSLAAGGTRSEAQVLVNVLEAIVPAKDPVIIDHNSYGTSWFPSQYPTLAGRLGTKFYLSDEFFSLIHAYHRVFYEHRGIFHQLGYGHGGRVGVEFAPKIEGAGKSRHIADWTLYDKHYGPLLDGSAFRTTRRGARPIPFVYLPVNPEWPASFLNWGEPGYEREFVNVVSEMEQHFREKSWTGTRFELFFNHKKRYKAFEWDGDETRFASDLPRFAEYRRLLTLAVPKDSPVQFVFRTDASWLMERQFRELAGIIDFWVCGGGMFGWYADNLAALKQRGDIVWTYGGTPPVDKPASHITTELLRAWMLGVDGFVRWQTVMPGNDPWFRFDGGGETLVYPGDRFGVNAPLASIRLKLQRNALQDLALLDSLQPRTSASQLRSEAARLFNGTVPGDWRAPRPKLADTNPEEWTNDSIDESIPKDRRFEAGLDAAAWNRVRSFVVRLSREARP